MHDDKQFETNSNMLMDTQPMKLTQIWGDVLIPTGTTYRSKKQTNKKQKQNKHTKKTKEQKAKPPKKKKNQTNKQTNNYSILILFLISFLVVCMQSYLNPLNLKCLFLVTTQFSPKCLFPGFGCIPLTSTHG